MDYERIYKKAVKRKVLIPLILFAVLVLTMTLLFIPMFKYTFPPNLSYAVFAIEYEDYKVGEVHKEEHNSYLDEDGNIVMEFSAFEIFMLRLLSNKYLNRAEDEGAVISSDYSKIEFCVGNDAQNINYDVVVEASFMSLIKQVFSMKNDPMEVKTEVIFRQEPYDDVVFSWVLPDERLYHTNEESVPLISYTLSSDYYDYLLWQSEYEIFKEYSEKFSINNVYENGDVELHITLLDWKSVYESCKDHISQVLTEKIEISEDYTDITVTYTDVSYSPFKFDRDYVINERDTQKKVDYIRRLCCLKQLLEGKSEEEIEVTTTSICEETGEVIDIVNLTIKNGVVNYFGYTVNYNKK